MDKYQTYWDYQKQSVIIENSLFYVLIFKINGNHFWPLWISFIQISKFDLPTFTYWWLKRGDFLDHGWLKKVTFEEGQVLKLF